MITLNLLPDIKKEYLKSQRKKRIFIISSFLITATAISSVILMSTYTIGVQKLQILNAQGNIDSSIKTLNETPDLAKIVSVQRQLEVLPSLHEGKAAVTRLSGFLKTITPNDVSLSSISIDFENHRMELKGQGKDFKSVNTFVDTLKNASFIHADDNEATLAFSSVVLGSIGKSEQEQSAYFKVTLIYDPLIFNNTAEGLNMSVPAITSTRSETEKPNSLFDGEIEEDDK